jgi:hypothetical protein
MRRSFDTDILASLPALLLAERDRLPSDPALYFVFDGTKRLLYVGKARDLRKRWQYHQRLQQIQTIPGATIAWIPITDARHLSALEPALIAYFDPLLNRGPIEAATWLPPVEKPRAEDLCPDALLHVVLPLRAAMGLFPEVKPSKIRRGIREGCLRAQRFPHGETQSKWQVRLGDLVEFLGKPLSEDQVAMVESWLTWRPGERTQRVA